MLAPGTGCPFVVFAKIDLEVVRPSSIPRRDGFCDVPDVKFAGSADLPSAVLDLLAQLTVAHKINAIPRVDCAVRTGFAKAGFSGQIDFVRILPDLASSQKPSPAKMVFASDWSLAFPLRRPSRTISLNEPSTSSKETRPPIAIAFSRRRPDSDGFKS